MKIALTYVALFVIFAILFVLPAVLLPLPLAQSQSNVNPLMLLALLLVDVSSIVYLIRRINLTGMKLFLAVLMVFWGLQTFMTQIETWYFKEAMPAISNEVLLKLFLNPLITAVVFIPIAIAMLGKWKAVKGEQQTIAQIEWKWVSILSLIYIVIYFLFGHYVAWQFEEVRVFYSGSPELHGFIEQFPQTIQTYSLILPFQFIRGFLWIACGLPIVLYLKGSRTEKVLACVFMYSILTCIQLTIDNPFMPAGVRMAHLWEVSTSNGLFGLLIGLILTRRPAASSF